MLNPARQLTLSPSSNSEQQRPGRASVQDNPAAGSRLDLPLPEDVFFEWFAWLIEQLRLVQGVEVGPESSSAIAAQLCKWPFSRLSAAQAWLFYGNPWKYRGNAKTLVLSDFCPSRDDLDRLRDVDALVVETREQRQRSIAGQIELARIAHAEAPGAPSAPGTREGMFAVMRLYLDEAAYTYDLEREVRRLKGVMPRRTTLEERLPPESAVTRVPEDIPGMRQFKDEIMTRFNLKFPSKPQQELQ